MAPWSFHAQRSSKTAMAGAERLDVTDRHSRDLGQIGNGSSMNATMLYCAGKHSS
jgi:hypothetical protein